MDVRLTLLKNKRFRIITCSQVNYTIAELNTHVVYRQRYVQSTRVFRQLYTRELILLFVSIKRLPIVSTAWSAPEYKSTDYYSDRLKSYQKYTRQFTAAVPAVNHPWKYNVCTVKRMLRPDQSKEVKKSIYKMDVLIKRIFFRQYLKTLSSDLLTDIIIATLITICYKFLTITIPCEARSSLEFVINLLRPRHRFRLNNFFLQKFCELNKINH